MKNITEIWSRIRAVGRRETLENGLDEEIRFHLDQQIEKNLRADAAAARQRDLLDELQRVPTIGFKRDHRPAGSRGGPARL